MIGRAFHILHFSKRMMMSIGRKMKIAGD